MSFAALLLELSLTRLFSVVLFYHFAFLAISIALLGLGAGAVFATSPPMAGAMVHRQLGARLCVATRFSFRSTRDRGAHGGLAASRLPNFWRLTCSIWFRQCRFFITGLLFSVVFARHPARITNFMAPICWAVRWPAWRWCRC